MIPSQTTCMHKTGYPGESRPRQTQTITQQTHRILPTNINKPLFVATCLPAWAFKHISVGPETKLCCQTFPEKQKGSQAVKHTNIRQSQFVAYVLPAYEDLTERRAQPQVSKSKQNTLPSNHLAMYINQIKKQISILISDHRSSSRKSYQRMKIWNCGEMREQATCRNEGGDKDLAIGNKIFVSLRWPLDNIASIIA